MSYLQVVNGQWGMQGIVPKVCFLCPLSCSQTLWRTSSSLGNLKSHAGNRQESSNRHHTAQMHAILKCLTWI